MTSGLEDSLKETRKANRNRTSFIPEGTHMLRMFMSLNSDGKPIIFERFRAYGYFSSGVMDPATLNSKGIDTPELANPYVHPLQIASKWLADTKNFKFSCKNVCLFYAKIIKTSYSSDTNNAWKEGSIVACIGNNLHFNAFKELIKHVQLMEGDISTAEANKYLVSNFLNPSKPDSRLLGLSNDTSSRPSKVSFVIPSKADFVDNEVINVEELTPLSDSYILPEWNYSKYLKLYEGAVTALTERINVFVKDDNEYEIPSWFAENFDLNKKSWTVDEVKEVLRIPKSITEPAPSMIAGIKTEYITAVGKLDDRLLILLDLEKILSADEVEKLEAIKE